MSEHALHGSPMQEEARAKATVKLLAEGAIFVSAEGNPRLEVTKDQYEDAEDEMHRDLLYKDLMQAQAEAVAEQESLSGQVQELVDPAKLEQWQESIDNAPGIRYGTMPFNSALKFAAHMERLISESTDGKLTYQMIEQASDVASDDQSGTSWNYILSITAHFWKRGDEFKEVFNSGKQDSL